jgi:cellulose synthase/poly-beta-1,6-N-acetylglucosamine synthase-like glycosyltransferase/peptidoglycan/xylan/chitin deacetylase (PgdA/CDA1 family)
VSAARRTVRRIGRPAARWSLLTLLLAALVVLLGAQGLSTRTTGRSATPPRGTPGPLAAAGPILAWDGNRLVSRGLHPGRRIALSFDDGPDPRWTPRIAETLHRLDVPATFFVVGSQVVRHPGVVRALHRQGFELGNHTFTHSDLASLPGWERTFQIGLTENALAGTVGVHARLVRPPYSSFPTAVTERQARALMQLAREGYVIALSNLDGEDWRRPGVEAIVRAVTPKGDAGGIVLLHDGGGDRSQTVAALERLVPRLRARGFEFVRVSDLAGLPRDDVELPAGGLGRTRGALLLATLAVARWATMVLGLLLVVVAVLFVARLGLLFAFARRHVRLVRSRPAEQPFAPPVSIVLPAFNEAVGIEQAVRSLAASDYRELEIIVVDDGSTDGTADLVQRLELPGVLVLRQANAGKPAALNRGIAAARHDVVVMVDADTIFEPETLAQLMQPLRDPEVGAVSGNTKVGNRQRLLGRWQHIEYVMGFNLDRRLYDVLQCMPTVPGAAGAFRRRALQDVGGLSTATLAEDTDLTLALGRAGWRVVYAEDAHAWTEAPASLRSLWRQRYRWCYGTLQAVWKHRAAVWRPGEERIGRRGLPYLVLFQIALPLLAPLIDVFSLYGLVFLDARAVVAFWIAFSGLQLMLGWYAFRLDRESPWVLWAMPIQQFVYRQLMYLVVIESILSAIRGTRLRWRPIARSGEVEVADGGRRGRPRSGVVGGRAGG